MSDSVKSNDSIFSMIKLGLILAVYAAVSCTVLAVVNTFTAPKIAQNQVEKVNKAMQTFFPEDGFTFESVSDYEPKNVGSSKIESVIVARKDGKVAGGAAQVSGPTYDQGTILIGVAADGTIKGLQFLKLTDSPGFGLKANDPTFKLPNGKTFYGQFEGKNANDGFIAGQTFDAISGATISSNAIAVLMADGSSVLLKYLQNLSVEAGNE